MPDEALRIPASPDKMENNLYTHYLMLDTDFMARTDFVCLLCRPQADSALVRSSRLSISEKTTATLPVTNINY